MSVSYLHQVSKMFGKGVSTALQRSRHIRSEILKKSSKGRRNQAVLEQLRNRYANRRCFILGNGPSLKKLDLSLLKHEITIGSNGIFLIKDEMGFLPTFLAVEDNLVAEDRADQLNEISGTTKIFPYDLAYCLKLDEWTVRINFVRDYEQFPKFSPDFSAIVYWGGTVTFLNLQLAYYLGCAEIYLLGLDHNYVVSDEIINGVITSERDDVNHIHPSYFGKGYRWHDPKVERMEQAYVEAKRFLDSRGVKIQNATAGGKLEVFDRIDYNRLFTR